MSEIPAATTFSTASPNIVYETFDDEVVIVNLDSGSYYSMSDVGAFCWQQMLAGCTVGQILSDLSSSYDADAEDVRRAVSTLIQQMEAEGLIVRRNDLPGNAAPVSTRHPNEKQTFEAPVLHRYEDMKQLLLIDPVHMVNADGWPNTRDNDDAHP